MSKKKKRPFLSIDLIEQESGKLIQKVHLNKREVRMIVCQALLEAVNKKVEEMNGIQEKK